MLLNCRPAARGLLGIPQDFCGDGRPLDVRDRGRAGGGRGGVLALHRRHQHVAGRLCLLGSGRCLKTFWPKPGVQFDGHLEFKA